MHRIEIRSYELPPTDQVCPNAYLYVIRLSWLVWCAATTFDGTLSVVFRVAWDCVSVCVPLGVTAIQSDLPFFFLFQFLQGAEGSPVVASANEALRWMIR